MSSKMSCAGCLTVVKGKDYLKCSKCHSVYDLACAGVSEKRFTSFYSSSTAAGKERRAIWTCPACLCNAPKGDNSSTPLRCHSDGYGSPPSSRVVATGSPNSPTDNVTQRKKPDVDLNEPQHAKQLRSSLRDGDTTVFTRGDFQEFKRMIAEQFQKMNDMMNNFQQSLSFFNDFYEETKKSMEDKSARIKKLEKENVELRSTLGDVMKRLNTIDQQSRSNNIEIQCVPEHRSENVVSTVLQLGTVVGCKIADTDILHATRVAKIDNQSNRPRSIVVKFTTVRIRDSLLAATINYNRKNPNERLNSAFLGIAAKKPQPIYVSEHLSVHNKSLHAAARIKAKEIGYRFVWVRNGRIFMRKTESSECISINNIDILKSLK
ncbi:uncharacterized protein LOC113233024 [Hyposmocoma kahamanoa]|uniref:uncharacterized protein LOC113233024 n=1 Tax=Hyposmocoma kahamanoa TaxID=1477025 RepID=UPI000E6DA4F6|nr:uncharacterized protein LOC113233024 [Hyposmocoma kahamanoa]